MAHRPPAAPDAYTVIPPREQTTDMQRSLILVPTDLERRVLAPALAAAATDRLLLPAPMLCGFGPIAAAARTAQLLVAASPERVLLVGIAGRLDDRLELAAAHRFNRVACHGIGVGSGDAFLSAEALGWLQWPGDEETLPSGDVLTCGGGDPQTADDAQAGLLLTACAASADSADVARRRQLYPEAVAEDMEGYGVALACRLRGVPLDIVRGISNTAGDRDTSRWRVTAALEAAAALAVRILADNAPREP
jgi:futalosine hydrolase